MTPDGHTRNLCIEMNVIIAMAKLSIALSNAGNYKNYQTGFINSQNVQLWTGDRNDQKNPCTNIKQICAGTISGCMLMDLPWKREQLQACLACNDNNAHCIEQYGHQ